MFKMKTSHPQTPFWGRFRKREVCVYLAHPVVCPRVWAAEIGGKLAQGDYVGAWIKGSDPRQLG